MIPVGTKIGREPAVFRRVLEGGRLVRLLASPAGFTILEAIVSATIVGIVVTGVLMMFGTGQTYIQSSGTDRIAAELAQQRIEQVRAAGYGKKFPLDPRAELIMTPVPGNPGFERTTVITDVCATNFAIVWVSPASCSPPTPEAQARLVVVTVRALNGGGTGTDPQTTPVVMQTVLVRR